MVNDIEKTHLVRNYYPILYYQSGDNEFIYLDSNLINIKSGNYINNDNEIIVSKSMNLNINDIVSFNINNYEYKFTVVGIYEEIDNISINNQLDSSIICSYNFLSNIVDKNNINEIIVLVNDYDNLDTFLEKLHSYNNYDTLVNDSNSSVLNRYKTFSIGINILSKVIILFIVLFVGIINFIIINDNIIDISILKSFGYSNKLISVLIFIYSLLLLLISLVPSIIIILILSILFNTIIILKISIIIKCILLFLIVNLLLLCFFYFYIRKINIIKLIKN